jgi:hypothetical protein
VIKELAWKEYREQRAVWIVMTLLTLFLTVGLPIALGSGGIGARDLANQVSAITLAVVLAAAYGLICGSILFAGEQEFQTLALLDRLTGWRTPIWGAKLVVGCGLVVAHGLLVSSILTSRGLEPGGAWMAWWQQWLLWIALLVGFALEGLAFGMAVSATCRNALSAAGLSVIIYALSWELTGAVVTGIVRGVFQLRPSTVQDLVLYHLPFALCLHAAIAVCTLWVSWRIFCRDDVRRGLNGTLLRDLPVAMPSFRRPNEQAWAIAGADPFRWLCVFWLVLRQAWPAMVVLSVAGLALVATFRSYGPAADLWLFAWPSFSIIVGAVCGLGVFLGEQGRGAERFLGDQRLPVGRIWTIKTGAWLLLAVTVCAAVLLDIVPFIQWIETVHLAETREGSAVQLRTATVGGIYLVLWLVYGFAIGQFCARVARKPVVAAFVSLLLCPVAVIWWPSLVCGGLSVWQVFAAPLVLLAATRLTLWEWVAGGPHAGWSPTLIGSAALSALCLAGGVEYRVWQIPNVGGPLDVREYVNKLPTPTENKAGQRTRAALEELDRRWWESQHLSPVTRSAEVPKTSRSAIVGDPLDEVLVKGPEAHNEHLDIRLKYVFRDNWAKRENDLPDLTLGMLGDPRSPRDYSVTSRFPNPSLGVRLICARALQVNDTGEALDHLAIALAIIRNAQNHAVYEEEVAALSSQQGVFQTFEKCLLAVPPFSRMDVNVSHDEIAALLAHKGVFFDAWLLADRRLLRKGLKILSRHASELPSFSDHLEAEYVVIGNKLKNSELWLKEEVVAVALSAPWEQERQSRLLNATFAGLLRAARCSYPEWLAQYQPPQRHGSAANILATAGWQQAPQGPGSSLNLDRLGGLIDASLLSQLVIRPGWGCRLPYDVVVCRLRALELQVALALFQLEKGRPARTLDELVPSYLSELPLDPFTGRPFGYRVSIGERLHTLSTQGRVIGETRDVAPGQGVVWSAGPDAVDNGGTAGGTDFPWYDPRREEGADLIFLVPSVPGKRGGG